MDFTDLTDWNRGRVPSGHPLCFGLSAKSAKSVVNSAYGSGSAGFLSTRYLWVQESMRQMPR